MIAVENQKYVKVVDLFQCKTCFHTTTKGCALGAFACDHGESYRPSMLLLPTITIDDLRPKGQWNIVEFDKAFNRTTIECSKCGMVEEVTLITYGLWRDFCPNCGADMRGGGEDA